jgi:hypothetical protein
MTGITIYLSILTLNVNRVNSLRKDTVWQTGLKKEDPTNCWFTGDHLIDRNKHWLWVKVWKKTYQANGPPKQAGVAILISDKLDFKLTLIK